MVNTTPYEALVEAAALLTDAARIGDLDEGDLATAAAIVQQNRAALESARRALGPQCAVHLRYEESFYSEHCAHLSDLRDLGRMFRAEAYIASQNGDYRAAATIGLDIFELANAIRRGGLVTDLLFSIAIARLAIDALRKDRTNVDSASRLLLVRELRRLEAEREPFAGIIARDREWEVAVGYADLYSTGPKMVDGGGKTGPWPLVAAGCADLYLDADDYWADG